MPYEKSTLSLPPMEEMELKLSYNTPTNFSVENEPPSHIHDAFEIYFNLSGSVSFVVGNHTYPIERGDLIVTRPYEYHHCVYHDNACHEHYCLELSCDTASPFASALAASFGGGPHIRLRGREIDRFRHHLDALRSPVPYGETEKLYHLFGLLHLAAAHAVPFEQNRPDESLPESLRITLDYVAAHYAEPLTVDFLANAAFVSVNTLERHFKRHLGITPMEYIKRKRLSEAMLLLREDRSVSEVAYLTGFCGASAFIQAFRRAFGVTPFRFAKGKTAKQ